MPTYVKPNRIYMCVGTGASNFFFLYYIVFLFKQMFNLLTISYQPPCDSSDRYSLLGHQGHLMSPPAMYPMQIGDRQSPICRLPNVAASILTVAMPSIL